MPRRPPIPKEIYIKGRRWEVRVTSKLDENTMGLCIWPARLILIRSGLNRQDAIETLIHEATHCVEFEYKVEIGHRAINKLDVELARLFEQLRRGLPDKK